MYGADPNPAATDEFAQLTGFTNGDPEVLVSQETYIGRTEEFAAESLGTFQLSELSTAFPELDLSRVVGDPTSIVYAFRALVPRASFVPEPGSLLLAGLAVAAIALRRRAAR
jgi:hypothetical protein